MECPKCAGELLKRTYGRSVFVYRCNECFGLFCKPEILVEMKQEAMSELLDSGNPRVGKQFNDREAGVCPECKATMEKKRDPRQAHITYEECTQCSGIFFDAGEFSDWKYETFVDHIRSFIARLQGR